MTARESSLGRRQAKGMARPPPAGETKQRRKLSAFPQPAATPTPRPCFGHTGVRQGAAVIGSRRQPPPGGRCAGRGTPAAVGRTSKSTPEGVVPERGETLANAPPLRGQRACGRLRCGLRTLAVHGPAAGEAAPCLERPDLARCPVAWPMPERVAPVRQSPRRASSRARRPGGRTRRRRTAEHRDDRPGINAAHSPDPDPDNPADLPPNSASPMPPPHFRNQPMNRSADRAASALPNRRPTR